MQAREIFAEFFDKPTSSKVDTQKRSNKNEPSESIDNIDDATHTR